MRIALAEGPLPAGTVAFHAAFEAGA